MFKDYDFSCWVIKYGTTSINGSTYRKDSLKDNDGILVPLCWNHQHYDVNSILGHAWLEHREEGIYVYCKLLDKPEKAVVAELIRDRGSVSISPCINRVKKVGKYITGGFIREVSLVPVRIDPDEAYYPVIRDI